MIHAKSIKELDRGNQAKVLMVIEIGSLKGCQSTHQDMKIHWAPHVKWDLSTNLSNWKPQVQDLDLRVSP